MKAILYAFLAAVFYAINIPASKVLLRDVGPTTMAALLYLGAGIGIAAISFLNAKDRKASAPLTHQDMPFVVGMIVLDIAAPIFLMLGIRYGTSAARGRWRRKRSSRAERTRLACPDAQQRRRICFLKTVRKQRKEPLE